MHTSYTDVLDLAAQDRLYLIQCINEKKVETKKAIDEATAASAAKRAK